LKEPARHFLPRADFGEYAVGQRIEMMASAFCWVLLPAILFTMRLLAFIQAIAADDHFHHRLIVDFRVDHGLSGTPRC
jgi:hypothetical protein